MLASELPLEMDALVLRRPGVDGLAIERRPVPRPGPGDVLVRISAAGVGGTVLKRIEQADAGVLPLVPGHEGAGEIVAVGPGVAGRLGDQVLLYYYASCGRCRRCLDGRWPLCTDVDDDPYPRLGVTRDGTFAEYVVVPERNALPAPEGLDVLAGTVAIDAVATPIHVCRRAQVRRGERVLVIGAAGGIGVHLLQVAARHGAHVIAADVSGTLEDLRPYGADEFVAAGEVGWARALAGSCDVVVDCVGTQATVDEGFDALGRGGRMVVLAVGPSPDVSFRRFHRMIADERALLGSKYADPSEVLEAADALVAGSVVPVISKVVDLAGVSGLLGDLAHGRLLGRGALRF